MDCLCLEAIRLVILYIAIGVFVIFIWILVFALCRVAGQADKRLEELENGTDTDSDDDAR